MNNQLEKYPIWYDLDEAKQSVSNKNYSGLISEIIENGYCILPDKIPSELLDASWQDLENAYSGNTPFMCHKEGIGRFPREREAELGLTNRRYSVHDFHQFSENALNIFTNGAFSGFLAELFDGTPLLLQSQMFRYGSNKGAHCDYVYMPFDNPLHTLTCWIAAEDITEDSGPLYFYPKSHLLPPCSFSENQYLWQGTDANMDLMQVYHDKLEKMCVDAGLEKKIFLAEKGQILIFHSRLAHGAMPSKDESHTRKSFALHLSRLESFTVGDQPIVAPGVLPQNNGMAFNPAGSWG